MYLVFDPGWLGTVWKMFTDLLTTPINRPLEITLEDTMYIYYRIHML
jgi:hypothetical protein